MANMCYSLVVSFLPLELDSNGLSASINGQIFGVYAVAVIGGSMMMTKLLIILNRKTILIMGIFLMSFSMGGLGLIKYLTDQTLLSSSAWL